MARKKNLATSLRRTIGRLLKAAQEFVSKRNTASFFFSFVVFMVAFQNCSNVNFGSKVAANSGGVLGGPANLTAATINLSVIQGTALPITASSILSANTPPAGQSLSLASVGQPNNGGQLSQSGTTYTFTDSTVGNSNFSYTITDTNGDQATGMIAVQVLAPSPAPGYFYASNLMGNLYVLNPSNGTLNNLLNTTYNGKMIGFNDLAIDGKGNVYGKDINNNIYIVNMTTGVATLYLNNFVNSTSEALGLTFLANGNLATVLEDSSGGFRVVSVNTTTLAMTTLVPASLGYNMLFPSPGGGNEIQGDVKALPDGYLYWTVNNNSSTLCKNSKAGGNQTIVKINPSNGATTEISCASMPSIVGLGFAQKQLYAFSGPGDLIQINLSTGASTLINATGDSFVGAASNPALW